jgi:hypothetical protein
MSRTTQAYGAQTTRRVYENGELVSQDPDPYGFAMVNYQYPEPATVSSGPYAIF